MGSKKLALVFQLVGIGWFIAVCLIGGAFLGSWIANFFTFSNADGVFIVLGTLLGLLCAGVGVVKLVKLILKTD